MTTTTFALIGGITVLLLILFQKNTANARDEEDLQDVFGNPVYYPRNKSKKQEKTEPFVGVSYAILFVLALFAFMQFAQNKEPVNYDDFQTSADYEQEDTNVIVIRP